VHAADPGGSIEIDGNAVASDRITPQWARHAGASFVHQDLGLFPNLTVAENLAAGANYAGGALSIRWGRLEREAQALLDEMGIAVSASATLGSLRSSQQTLVAIARALNGRDRFHRGILVLDEPTARLPQPEIGPLLESLRRLASAGQTILFVSHRLPEVLDLADDLSVLRDGTLVATRTTASVDAHGVARLITGDETAGLDHAEPRRREGSGAKRLELAAVVAGPVDRVSLAVAAGEIVGLAGLVGSGRSSVLETIFGVHPPQGGAITVDGRALPAGDIAAAMRAGVAMVPEDRGTMGMFATLGIPLNLSAASTARYWRRPFLRHRLEAADAESTIALRRIRCPATDAPMWQLSGGNQQKVLMARWLSREPTVLLLDEPTQGVDVGARAHIHEWIARTASAGCAVLIASSDFDELAAVCDRVLVLRGGRIDAQSSGGAPTEHWIASHVYGGTTNVA